MGGGRAEGRGTKFSSSWFQASPGESGVEGKWQSKLDEGPQKKFKLQSYQLCFHIFAVNRKQGRSYLYASARART